MKLTFLIGVVLLLALSLFAFMPETAPDLEPGGLELAECLDLGVAEILNPESAKSAESPVLFSDIYQMANSAPLFNYECESRHAVPVTLFHDGLAVLVNPWPNFRGLDENKFI